MNRELSRRVATLEAARTAHRPYLAGGDAAEQPAPDLWPTIARLAAWLDDRNGSSDTETALRILKVTEEAGEVAQAWIGYTGQNPRKGHSHTLSDVTDELCDVIVAAAVCLASIVDDPGGYMALKLQRIAVARLDTAAGGS